MNANTTNRPPSRRYLPYLGAVLLVALIAAGLWPKPVPVEIAAAGVGPLRASVSEEGKTRIKQRYVVSAPVTGQLRRIPFKAGAEVTAGQTVVAVIDPVSPTLLDVRSRATAEARRDTAAANREKARAAHTLATNELQRFERLFADQTISVQELDNARFREAAAAKDLAAAESALRQAEAELEAFSPRSSGRESAPIFSSSTPTAPRADQSRLTSAATEAGDCPPTAIKAPASGRILKVFEENSRVVAAGTPLVEIGDPADLEVVVEVLSRDGAMIAPGDKVELEQWGGSEPLPARVRLVEPAAFTKVSALGVEEQRVNVVADLVSRPVKSAAAESERLPLTPALSPGERETVRPVSNNSNAQENRNPRAALPPRPAGEGRGEGQAVPQLGDNFRVEARIITWESPEALKVPVGALFRFREEWAVFVMEGGRARLRPVKVGRSSGTETQILAGLKAGEQVILYPGSRVRDGQRVKPIQL